MMSSLKKECGQNLHVFVAAVLQGVEMEKYNNERNMSIVKCELTKNNDYLLDFKTNG